MIRSTLTLLLLFFKNQKTFYVHNNLSKLAFTLNLFQVLCFLKTIYFSSNINIQSLIFIVLSIVSSSIAQNSDRCYSFDPGITIKGAEYRRDYGINRKTCAEVCRYDSCCMAYEWQKKDGICTLKSRSLNGTVTTVNNGEEVTFGLCLDYNDSERDRFWDHEIGGVAVASFTSISRNKCADLCLTTNNNLIEIEQLTPKKIFYNEKNNNKEKRQISKWKRNINSNNNNGVIINNIQKKLNGVSSYNQKLAVIYSWRTDNKRNIDALTGHCECIRVLESVKINFGSFSGFLI